MSNNDQSTTEEVKGFDIEDLETNLQKEREGVWCPLPGGASAKVARVGNEDYKRVLRSKFKGNRAALEQDDDLAAKLSEDILMEVYAETILMGVRKVRAKGVELPEVPDYKTKLALLKVKDFRERIKGYADTMEVFQDKAEEAAIAD